MKRFLRLNDNCLIDREAVLCVYIKEGTDTVVITLKRDGGITTINWSLSTHEEAVNILNQFQEALK